MGLIANKGGDFVQIERGTYIAICYRVIDLGTQHGKFMKNGKEVDTSRKQVLISWEFPTELIPEGEAAGKPYAISTFYTLSLNKQANLRADLESWRGRAFTEQELEGFDLRNILGKPCMINVIRNEKDKSVVSAITPLPKGFVAPPAVNLQVVFDIDNWDNNTFQSLPDGVKAMIVASDECKQQIRGGNQPAAGGPVQYDERNPPPDTDIPF